MNSKVERVDGLIERALEVMGAKPTLTIPSWYELPRVNAVASISIPNHLQQALFIHECKLYLREKG
jgi:hypothetical protein